MKQLLFIAGFLFMVCSVQSQNPADTIKSCSEEVFTTIQEFFKYDKNIPLNVKIVAKENFKTYTREKFVFTGFRNSRVPGYLAIPKSGKTSYPCMVLLHPGAFSKEDWWTDSSLINGFSLVKKLLAAGFAIMTLDAEYHGERAINNDFVSLRTMWFENKEVYAITDLIRQSTIDYRRAFDYLLSRKEIDSTRVGMMGYSMGAVMTTYLCTQIPQIKTAVICSAPLYAKEISPAIYLANFIPRIGNMPVLLLLGEKDEMVSTLQANLFHSLLKTNKKKLILYPSGHFLPKQYLTDAENWIKENIIH